MTVRRDLALSPRQAALKVAFRQLVEAVGGVEAAALYCRVGKSQLSDYCSLNTDSFAPVDVVADLEELTTSVVHHPIVTRQLARRSSHALIPVTDPHAPDTLWSSLAGRLAKEGGDLIQAICSALSNDNDVDRREALAALPEAEQLLDLAAETFARLKARAEGRE